VLAYVRQNGSDDERTQHLITDVTVDLAVGRAVVTSRCTSSGRAPPHRTPGIRHVFGAVRTPDGWRLASADVALAWTQ
jgi:hypothetical protein